MAEPKVRFKRNDGSSYPAWATGKLGDITEKIDRKAPKGSTAPVMMVSQGNGFIYQADKYSRENAGQSLKNYTLLKQGEFAYNHGASKAKPYGVAYCLSEETEARVPFVYHTFRIIEGINHYWHEALNTTKMDRQLKRMVSSGARMDGLLNINYDNYMDVDINIPCTEEQKKIADFLSAIDDVISTSEQEVSNLESQKKAVMKKIFSQDVRFKRDDGTYFPDWEENALSERTSNFRSGKNIEADRIKTEGLYPVIGGNGIRGYTDTYNYEGIYAVVGRQGALCGNVNLIEGKNYLTEHAVAVRGDELTDTVFLSFLLSNMNLHKYSGQSAQPGLAVNEIIKLTAFFPSLEEQRLIADFLTSFDEAIAAAKKELELWKQLKKGLLQQMFV